MSGVKLSRGTRWSRVPARGFTLIEVLVAVVVLSIGLLGLAGLQLVGVQNTQSAYTRTQAAFLAYDIVDSMRANPDAARAGAYAIDFDDDTAAFLSCLGEDKDCTPAELATHDLRRWRAALGSSLGAGTGAVAAVAAGGTTRVTVTVRWIDTTSSLVDGNVIPEQLVLAVNL